ncbi:histone deacetylase family protein [Sphingomicrobium astaxanthinifaciens]|uniref:histone deacetylase family protein n=1 Tax=Sphingomicrobium astaxanthinifaciens TaxID=1227949 RepID=UPI001FCBFEA8|nr:histone deacetylase [Sphingomicrobium astaxanthinifaciens]MCJ7421090.1 histone deacetylase [Sphingomicrobium astaxanthinifaciens]
MAPRPERGSFRFDKYQLVMAALRASGASMTEHAPPPMPRKWLEAVHDPDYVAEVFETRVPTEKGRRIGFPVTAHIRDRVRHTSGGTWLAARLAMEHGYAANSAAGSHHARYDTGAGYCVFNDLAVAAHRLLAEGQVRQVLIVDLDVHQGDGTASLTAGRPEIFTFSIHAEKNFPVRKAASDLDIGLPDGTGDAAYLARLEAELPRLIDAVGPDLLLYQAGVDPHVGDKLGRLALSRAGLAARDRLVVRAARQRGVPVASALGGGYGDDQHEVARRHAASMLAMADENARVGAARDMEALR